MLDCIYQDNFFIAGYTLFLLAFALKIWMQTKQHIYSALVVLALLIGLADFGENEAMKTLIGTVQGSTTLQDSAFSDLHFWTWSKWLGIAAFFLGITPFLWNSRAPGRILAVVGGGTAALAVLALISAGMIETYVAAVFLVFPLAIVFCFWYQE